jgi:hypothetical protein
MPSRPDVTLNLNPPHPCAGATFDANVILSCSRDTRCSGIDVRLIGSERRFVRVDRHGTEGRLRDVDIFEERTIVREQRRLDGRLLTAGRHELRLRFALPADAPPTYRSELTRIEYSLEVRVDVPWWFDRNARFEIPVTVAASPRAARRGVRISAGGRGTRSPIVEATLARDEVELGGTIAGAVSASESAPDVGVSLEASLVAIETAYIESTTSTKEVARVELPCLAGALDDGAPVPFQAVVPRDAVPTFGSAYIGHDWSFEVRAKHRRGDDVVLRVPIRLVRREASPEREPVRLEPIGQARRRQLFTEVATRHGLLAEGERVFGVFGEVMLEVQPSLRRDGLCLVAGLGWPTLGMDLALTDRHWAERPGEARTTDREFSERFTAHARERAQLDAFIDPYVRRLLLGYEQATLDDEGGALATSGARYERDDLEAFVGRAIAIARALARARSRIPPPAALAHAEDAWRTFARTVGGRFEVGRLFVHGAEIDGEWFDLGNEFDGTTRRATLVRLRLPRASRHEERTRVAEDSLSRAGYQVDIDDAGLVLRIRTPVDDPRSLLDLFPMLATIARSARAAAPRSAYS